MTGAAEVAHHRLRTTVAGVATAAAVLAGVAVATPAGSAPRTFSSLDVTADGKGYALVAKTGEVYAFGSVKHLGNPKGFDGTIVGISVTDDGKGYAAVSSKGQVYAFGTAKHFDNPKGDGTIAGIGLTGDGQGYAAVSSAGQVYAYGNAKYFENPKGFTGSIAGISVTADGQGYAAVSSAGQVYAYGSVAAAKNPTGFTGSIAGISVTADGKGYAAVSSAGQVYAYGSAKHEANPTGFTGSIAGISLMGDGKGYGVVSSAGQTYTYGNVKYWGNGDPGSAAPNSTVPGPAAATTDATTARLAGDILELARQKKIVIQDFSEGRKSDTADRSLASQQLADLAAGKEAHLSDRCANNAKLPRTVPGDVKLLQFLADLGNQYPYKISVLFGQCHTAASSLHYRGKAVDFGCGFDTKVPDEVGRKYGVARNFETCAKQSHFHYSVGGH